ncbi:glycosyltransferase family 4 protein [Streptomyces sp. NPDC055055]
MHRSHPAGPAADGPGRRGTANEPDPFAAARAGHWNQVADFPRHRPEEAPNLLSELVRAEYGADEEAGGGRRPLHATSGDLALARLRRRLRSGDVPPPAACVDLLLDGCEPTRAAVFDAWPAVVHRHGSTAAATALRRALHATRAPDTAPTLLDLAAATRLHPLSPSELLRLSHDGGRRVRHAAWRLLDTYDRTLLSQAGLPLPEDAYETALLRALRSGPLAGTHPLGLRPGIVVAQSMLLGHLDRPGEGLSGGLGVLLGSLGDALARTDHVAGVLTVVTTCIPELEADPVLLHRRGRGHWILRLPVDSPHQVRPEEMGRHREAMAWWAARLFASSGRPIDILHVRYADDGSLALAEAARRAGLGLVFTATPDPHRQMTERHDLPGADPAALRHDLHRVYVADRLVERADRVIGIAGRGGGSTELLRHFPQLAAGDGGAAPGATPEGIPPYRPTKAEARRCDPLLDRIDAVTGTGLRTPTVLLCVGRLHPVKQQDLLVRAWIESGCHQESVLVLVGGAPLAEDAVERAMRARIHQAAASCPEARRRLILLPALPNTAVRALERSLAGPARRLRTRYVCPSAKEEFGLAVLEAMEAGLLVAAPRRGGVPHYLVDGVNGLLLDTSTVRTLGEGLRRLLRVDDEAAAEMTARARSLVRSTYSSTAMAGSLAGHYMDVVKAKDRTADGTHRPGAAPVDIPS